MKILILNNLFNNSEPDRFIIFKRLLNFYQKRKIKNLINSIIEKSQIKIDIDIINYPEENLNLDKNCNVHLFSEMRNKLSEIEYQDIIKNVKQNTKKINIKFQENLQKLKIFNFKSIPLGDLLEIHLIRFINNYSGDIQLIKHLIMTKEYEKIILLDCDPDFLYFFLEHVKNKKIEYYNNKLIILFQYFFKKLKLISLLIRKIIKSLIGGYKKITLDSNYKRNILLIANSRNHYHSIKPVYKELKKHTSLNPIIYSQKNQFPLAKLTEYFKFIIRSKRNWSVYFDKICNDMGIYSNLIRAFYGDELYLILSKTFNEYYNLVKIFTKITPILVTISNESLFESKLATKFFKLKKIPTIYIPHASVPIVGEVICKKDYTYSALWGEQDINYYLNLGMPKERFIITGNPKFEKFYMFDVKRLNRVHDMFDKRVYEFNDKKITIILATSPYDNASKRRLIETVADALKQLKLIDDLIIKLHPSESGLFHRKIIKNLDIKPIIVRDYNILELLKSSNILISCVSSIILEAMIIGTPIIQANFLNLGFTYIQPYGFTNEQYLRVANTSKALIEHIKELTQDKESYIEYSNKLRESSERFSFFDKNYPPTKKIVDLILKIIKEKPNIN